MKNFFALISQSLGISQNAKRFQTQLSEELNLQTHLLGRIVSDSTKLVAISVAAAIVAIFALAVTIALIYQLLEPEMGSAGALAIIALVLGLFGLGLVLLANKISRDIPKLKPITIPPIYVPEEPIADSAPRQPYQYGQTRYSSNETVPNSNGMSPATSQLSDFLMSELRDKFYKSSFDKSIKSFATTFSGNSDELGRDAIHGLEQQLAQSSTTKKYAILAAAMTAGFLLSKRSL
jgi:uncharacterized membrane protein YbaN (DUF454 family)